MRSIGSIAVLVCAMAALAACSSGGSGNGTPSAGVGTGGGAGDGGSGSGGSGDPDSPFRTITVLIAPEAGGTVIEAGAPVIGERNYALGANLELKAEANQGYVFAAWVFVKPPPSAAETLRLEVTENLHVLATFAKETELLRGRLYSGLPKSGIPQLNAPFSRLDIAGDTIVLRHLRGDIDADPETPGTQLTTVCEYEGRLDGIELPARVTGGTFFCKDGDIGLDLEGVWSSGHIAKTDRDAFIMEIEATTDAGDRHDVKYSGFMVPPALPPPHYDRLPAWSFTDGAVAADLDGSYRGYLRIEDPDECAPADEFAMVQATTEISVAGNGLQIVQTVDLGASDGGGKCTFTGTLDDVSSMLPLAVSEPGSYACDGEVDNTGTWTSPRIALTSPARDSILVDLNVVPEGGCSYRVRSIGFE